MDQVGVQLRRALLWGLLLSIAFVTGSSKVWAGNSKFVIPAGFLDLSPGAPAVNFEQVPKESVERSRTLDGYAVALKDGEIVAEFSLRETDAPAEIPRAVEIAVEILVKQNKNAKVPLQIVEKGTTKIHGFECGRILTKTRIEGEEFRKLLYLLPARSKQVWVSFDAHADDFETYRPLFETFVRTISGVAPTKIEDPNREWAKMLGAIGFAALAGKVLRQLFKRKRRRTEEAE